MTSVNNHSCLTGVFFILSKNNNIDFMFTAGLSISVPKQFTLLAVIFRPALKNPKRTLALHHHLRRQTPLPLPARDSTDKISASTGVQILLDNCHFCCRRGHSISCISLLFLISQAGLFLLSGLTWLGNKALGAQVRQTVLCKSSADLEAPTPTRFLHQKHQEEFFDKWIKEQNNVMVKDHHKGCRSNLAKLFLGK